MGRILPVMKLEQHGAAMNTKAGAISSGCAALLIAVCEPNDATSVPQTSPG